MDQPAGQPAVFPGLLSALYLAIGAASLFAYLQRDADMSIAPLAMALSIWQGIVLWKADLVEPPTPEKIESQHTQT